MAIGELTSAFGNTAGDLGQAQSEPKAPVAPEPTRAPAQAQAPAQDKLSPEEQADLLEAQTAQAGPGDKASPSDNMSPEERADLLEAQQVAGQAEKQGPPEPVSGLTAALGVVKRPDGSYGVQGPGGKVRDLTAQEKKAASYVAKGLRIGGPTVGAILGGLLGAPAEALPVAGTAAHAALTGAGAVAGGDLAHPAASTLEEMSGEQPQERTNAQRTLEAIMPAAGGAVAESFAKSGLQRAAPSATEVLEQLMTKARSEVAPQVSEQTLKDKSFKDYFSRLNQSYTSEISSLKAKSYLASGGQKYPVPELVPTATSTLGEDFLAPSGQVRDRVPEGSAGLINLYEDLKEASGAQGGKGLTIKELDRFTERAQKLAEYDPQAKPTLPEQKAKALAAQLRNTRDDIMGQVFDKAGDANSAQALREARARYATYNDTLTQVRRSLRENPTDATAALIKKDNPESLKKTWEMLDDEHRDLARGKFLDNLFEGRVSAQGIKGAAIDKELNSYDPKSLDVVLGDARPKLQELINYAKALEKAEPGTASYKSLISRALSLTSRYGMFKAGVKGVAQLFRGNPDAQREILSELYKKYPADISRAVQPTAGGVTSQVVRGAGGAAGATLGTLLAHPVRPQSEEGK